MNQRKNGSSALLSALKRLGAPIVVTLFCLTLVGIPSVAFGLDKDQIVQMAQMGLDDRAIMGAIDSAGDNLQLDDEDVENLRSRGVSETVINHLRRRGYISSAAAELPGDDFDEFDELAPIPADEDESEDQRLERERLEAEREAEIQRRIEEARRQEEEDARRDRELARLMGQLPRANDLVNRGANMEAARIYLEFLDFGPDRGSSEWYDATFGLAKALVQEGVYSGATTPVLDILMEGADRRHFDETFRMLMVLTRNINFQPPLLEELTQFNISNKSARFQEQFNYYMGKFFFDYSRMDLALEYLNKLPRTAQEYPESRYLAGVAQLDPEVNDIPGALRNFEAAILAAEAAPGGNEDVLQMGYLALARVFFEVGFYDVALFYYQQIPRESSRHADAVFESAWSYFMKNDFERALGAFHSLHSPFYDQRYYPELYILEATVYLNLCKFPKSHRSLAEFNRRYLDQRPVLRSFLDSTIEPREYWEMMNRVYENGSEPELPRLFTNAVLENISFANIHRVIRSLEAERASLLANIDALGDFGEQVLERVEEQLETNIEEGGIVIMNRLTAVDRELEEWQSSATRIEIDIETEGIDQLRRELQNSDFETAERAAPGTTLMVVADDWQSWPFEGEYWVDEVGNYRSRMRTECIEQ